MQPAWSNILQSLGMTAEEVWRERSQFQGLELLGSFLLGYCQSLEGLGSGVKVQAIHMYESGFFYSYV